ncbi:MAG: metal-transporting ATPase, partial [Oscillospiraceae bacterium]|nr:metal-transporting ATPase [Oscillospiraceae bacterium]
IRTVLLTGDNARTAAAVAAETGVDEVVANVLPDGKAEVVRRLAQKGKTVMIGDGINDAPALTVANVGMAIGAGADVAVDAADVVLVNSRLGDAAAAVRLGRAVLRNVKQNLFWAFAYNVIGIPLAAGVWIPVFGWEMDPMFGALAMSLSSFCVVTNALRLNLVKVHSPRRDRPARRQATLPLLEETGESPIASEKKEENEMEKTVLEIEGMMCAHCEARVKAALEGAAPGAEVTVSHKKGVAELRGGALPEAAVLTAAVTGAGYRVTAVKKGEAKKGLFGFGRK